MKLQASESVELKAEYTPAVKKEVVAFANSKGSVVYIGVADDGEVIGVGHADFVMDQLSSAIRDGIRPDVSMFTDIELLKIEDKPVIKLTIHQGSKRLYYLSEKGLRPSGVYLRTAPLRRPLLKTPSVL
ncbi:MAG TPA: ATP-binding protein [Clostridiaceae bacterium]|jgi:ATP-dependent DNA helicase RecG|nr:ATP-binding protein [Clostridiaceae bacterium]